ncbi:hypothetical protein DPMN_147048 [Dreissena polymorpha]|uniref:Uncharacterized protein n=1 Tax=Dreissena polymorpha TaxID=45954 RepID=A0A9D4J2L8_DREPO|nr:hypothetical protein DPMN_147048 [Dreissena polymorpha]
MNDRHSQCERQANNQGRQRPGRDDNQCLSTRPSQQTQELTHHSHSGCPQMYTR